MRVVQAEGATYGLTSNVGAELGLRAVPGPEYALRPAVDIVHVVGEGLSKTHDGHIGAVLVKDALLVCLIELVQGSLVRLHRKKNTEAAHDHGSNGSRQESCLAAHLLHAPPEVLVGIAGSLRFASPRGVHGQHTATG